MGEAPTLEGLSCRLCLVKRQLPSGTVLSFQSVHNRCEREIRRIAQSSVQNTPVVKLDRDKKRNHQDEALFLSTSSTVVHVCDVVCYQSDAERRAKVPELKRGMIVCFLVVQSAIIRSHVQLSILSMSHQFRHCGLKVERAFAAGVAVGGGNSAFRCGWHQYSVMSMSVPKSDLKCVWVYGDMHVTGFDGCINKTTLRPGTIH